jgi:hypothetical protein
MKQLVLHEIKKLMAIDGTLFKQDGPAAVLLISI